MKLTEEIQGLYAGNYKTSWREMKDSTKQEGSLRLQILSLSIVSMETLPKLIYVSVQYNLYQNPNYSFFREKSTSWF